MEKTKRKTSPLEGLLKNATENYTTQTVLGHAIAKALLNDYAKTMAAIEGISPQEVYDRIIQLVHAILYQQGWATYPKEGRDGKPEPAVGMRWKDGLVIKAAPEPVLRMPDELDMPESKTKAVKKTRKRYT